MGPETTQISNYGALCRVEFMSIVQDKQHPKTALKKTRKRPIRLFSARLARFIVRNEQSHALMTHTSVTTCLFHLRAVYSPRPSKLICAHTGNNFRRYVAELTNIAP